MPGSSNTSFIPKKNGAQRDRQTGGRQIYVGTLIVRILFVASLLAVAGVYAYEYSLSEDLDAEVTALNTAIATFNDAEMQRVVSTDKRLAQVSNLMGHTFSVAALLKAIEDSTAESVQITQLTVTRDVKNNIEIESELDTASFDSALFQKNILKKSDTLSILEITDLQLKDADREKEEEGEVVSDEETRIAFKATLAVDIAKVPHTAGTTVAPVPVSIPPTQPVTASTSVNTAAEIEDLTDLETVESNQVEI
jgi:hypothetical protein